MTAGVTFEYHMLNLIVSMCAFIGFSPLYGIIFIPLHVFGWLVCRYDTHFYHLRKAFLIATSSQYVIMEGSRL
ncbi:VirB3 family type IV secretion system protein [Legionella pneumophila]|nr:VirB3 family type IV secretion system protein [Legionella pneumophila]